MDAEAGASKTETSSEIQPDTTASSTEKPEPRNKRESRETLGSRVRTAVRETLNAAGLARDDDDSTTVKDAKTDTSANRAPKPDRVGRLLSRPDKPREADANSPQSPPSVATGLADSTVFARDKVSFDVEPITELPKSVLSTGLHAVSAIVPARSSRAPVDAPPAPAPDVADALAGAVSTVVDTVLNPFSVNSVPDTPAEPPTAWAVLAFARRELERTFRQPENLLSSVVVTRQAETPVALAPGIVVPPELTGHVVVTDDPSLTDRLAVFGTEILRDISEVIGVNITIKLGEAILSPTPPWFTTIGLDVKRETYEGGDVWVITPPNPTGERVVAVHGGGFVYPPNIVHWLDYTQMARQTGATVIVPRYPLIPDGGTAANTIPPMADFIADQVETYGAENVSVYGDSAGGTLAMLAVQKAVRDCGGDADCLESRVPSRMVLVSPGLSGPEFYTDPNVVLVDDPVSPIPNPDDYKPWQGNSPEELWNPMAGPTTGLPPTVIYIGTREIGAPGALLFAEKVVDENPGADITVVIGMGQIHDWALGGGIPINSQTGKYRDDVYRQLGIVGDGTVDV